MMGKMLSCGDDSCHYYVRKAVKMTIPRDGAKQAPRGLSVSQLLFSLEVKLKTSRQKKRQYYINIRDMYLRWMVVVCL